MDPQFAEGQLPGLHVLKDLQLAKRSFILFPNAASWQLSAAGGRPSVTEVATSASSATADAVGLVVAALKTQGYAGEPVILAIPASWCLGAGITTTGLPPKNRRRAMVYRLEEKIPLAAEEVIADFVPFGNNGNTLGVCARKSILAPVVEALEANGIAVAVICPAALLALQHLLETAPLTADHPRTALWPAQRADELELFTLRDRFPTGWYVVPNEPRDVALHLLMERRRPQMAAADSASIAVAGLTPPIRAALSSIPDLRIVDLESFDASAAATGLAGSILAGRITPWIDLRRDDLAVRAPFRQVRTPLVFAAAAAAICMLCLSGGMLIRASRFDRAATHFADARQSVFHRVFPNAPPPPDVRSRLAAEARGLDGLSGAQAPVPRPQAGLITLRDLLANLPSAGAPRYRVLELRLDQGRFTLEGQAAAHGDADSIASSLRQGGGFIVDPPRTEQLAGHTGVAEVTDDRDAASTGVAFTIGGAVAGELSPVRGGAK